jgi:hypothetical protein
MPHPHLCLYKKSTSVPLLEVKRGKLVVEAVRLWETRRVFQGLWEGGAICARLGEVGSLM